MGEDVMAAKRVASTAINWAELSKKIPDAQRGAFAALKARSDASLRSINSLPEALPAIDWAVYQGRVAPALVDDFQKVRGSFRSVPRRHPGRFHRRTGGGAEDRLRKVPGRLVSPRGHLQGGACQVD